MKIFIIQAAAIETLSIIPQSQIKCSRGNIGLEINRVIWTLGRFFEMPHQHLAKDITGTCQDELVALEELQKTKCVEVKLRFAGF